MNKRRVIIFVSLLLTLAMFCISALSFELPTQKFSDYYINMAMIQKDTNLYDKTTKGKKVLVSLKEDDAVLILSTTDDYESMIKKTWSMVLYNNKPAYVQTKDLIPKDDLSAAFAPLASEEYSFGIVTKTSIVYNKFGTYSGENIIEKVGTVRRGCNVIIYDSEKEDYSILFLLGARNVKKTSIKKVAKSTIEKALRKRP